MCSLLEELVNEEKKDMVLKLRKRDVAYDIIAESTGMSIEQVKEIEKSALQTV